MIRPLALLIAAGLAGGALVLSAGGGTSSIRPIITGDVNLVDQSWTCSSAVDIDFVKVSTHVDKDAVVIGKNCSGRIGSIAVDTWSGDGIKIQNAAPVAHDLTIGSGYVKCWDKLPVLHQDGAQIMGGTSIHFEGVHFDCGRPLPATLIDADWFVNKGGSMDSTPTDIICDGCEFGPGAAHTVNLGESIDSGVRNSTICPDRTSFNGAFDLTGGAFSWIDENNTQPAAC